MTLAFFIAKKFLLSLRKIKVVHLINIITLFGIIISSTALILSSGVYNGLESLIMATLKSVEPDMKIELRNGKVFDSELLAHDEIKKLNAIKAISEVLETKVFLIHNGHSILAQMKGVKYLYGKEPYLGKFVLQSTKTDDICDENSATIGAGLAYSLNLTHRGQAVMVCSANILNTTLPRIPPCNPAGNFILVNKIFSINKQHDEKYIITPLHFAQQVASIGDKVSSIGIYLEPDCDFFSIKEEIEKFLDSQRFVVQTIYEKETTLLRAIKTEKMCTRGIFIIILLIATLNVLFATVMFFLIKKDDLTTLCRLGILPRTLKKVTIIMGIILAIVGASVGVIVAYALEWVQKTYKIISLGENVSVGDAYPIDIRLQDVTYAIIAVVTTTLFITSAIAAAKFKDL